MSTRPFISVLLPIRDAEATLDSCLRSLVEQTFTDWECLAVDDGSRDGSRAVLARWAGRDARIHALESLGEGGIVAALETGRIRARGLFMARQDADDRSLPDRFAEQIDAMERDGGLAVVGCRTHTPGDLNDGMRRYLEWLAGCTDPAVCAREIWVESPIAHPTALIRASVLADVGGYRECGWPEDYDLWLRIHRAGWRIANIPHALYEWTDSPGRLSRRDSRYAQEAFLRCRVHHLRRWFAERGMTRRLVVWGAGRDGRRLARAWENEAGADAALSTEAGAAGDGTAGDGTATDGAAATPAPEIAGFVDIDPRKIGGRRRGRPILDPESARLAFAGAFYLAAVGVPGAREVIRGTLGGWGMIEGEEFLCLH